MEKQRKIEQHLFPSIQEMEGIRKESYKKIKKYQRKTLGANLLVGIAMFFFLFAFFAFVTEGNEILFLGFLLGLYILIPGAFSKDYLQKKKPEIDSIQSNYATQFKEKIILPIIETVAPHLEYVPHHLLSDQALHNLSTFMNLSPNEYRVDDQFQFSKGNLHVKIIEVFAKKRLLGHLKSSNPFSGLIFNVQLPDAYQSMYIYDQMETLSLLKKETDLTLYNSQNYEHLHILFSPEIEKPNLPKTFLDFLLKLRKEFDASFIFKVNGSALNLAMQWDNNIINPQLTDPLESTQVTLKNEKILDGHLEISSLTQNAIHKYYEEIKLCKMMVDQLELLIDRLHKKNG